MSPVITKLSPAAAKPGVRLTISGRGFGAKRGKNIVLFGNFKATSYLRWSATRIICRVPVIPAGRLFVTVSVSKRASKGKRFTVRPLPLVIPKTTDVLSKATVAGATTTDNLTYTFTDTSQTSRLKRGDVIVGKPTAALPDGIFRKVTAVSPGGASVTTIPATLGEVFTSAQFSASHAITQSDFTGSPDLAPGVRLLRSVVVRPKTRLLTFRLTDVNLSKTQSLGATLGPVSVSGTITLSITVHVAGAIDWGGVKSFETSETTTVSSDLHASVTEDLSLSDELTVASWGLGELPGFSVWVGPVPLYFQPTVSIFVGAKGQFSAGVTTDAGVSVSGTLGLSYANGAFKPISNFPSPKPTCQPPTLFASGSLKAYAGAQIGLDLYALAGPYLRLDGFGTLAADTRQTPWWTLKGGLEASVGAHFGVDAGFIDWNPSWQSGDLTLAEWTLKQATTPAPKPTPPPVPTPTPTVTPTVTSTPTPTPGSGDWAAVSCGAAHTLALKKDGTLWAWGDNGIGQLGVGTVDTAAHSAPTEVGIANGWAEVSCGNGHTLALKSDGTLWAWGWNVYGQLGLGTFDSVAHPTPTEVGSDSDWAAVSCGPFHTVALKKGGTLWAWGCNGNGQLGLGAADDNAHPTPTQVGSATDWAAVFGGYDYTLALKKDGSLWAWGSNGNSQLGLGDTIERDTPTQVGSATDWAAVSCGAAHTLALKKDGTLWAWGLNDYGQLGLGAADDSAHPTPTQVGSAADWAAVSAGYSHTLALKQDGTLWAWGWNNEGELGLGDITERDAPTQVGSDSDWAAVSCGDYHTVAAKTHDTLWAWGLNDYGQLGLGDTADRLTPTEMGSGSP